MLTLEKNKCTKHKANVISHLPTSLDPASKPQLGRYLLALGDARNLGFLRDQTIHLIVTSPPYGPLKEYPAGAAQLGNWPDYESFLDELDRVWSECFRVLVPGGRICCVVGDITLSRRRAGRHQVLPLSSDIMVRGRRLGFDVLTPIYWFKVTNIRMEASRSSRFLGKPYLPNGVIRNDRETIVMLRKPGYRKPSPEMEELSRIPKDDYFRFFTQCWNDITGASTKTHPAPFPVEIPSRLVQMFSFVGDTVLDPFVGSGTTVQAAIQLGRNAVGLDVEPSYFELARARIRRAYRLTALH